MGVKNKHPGQQNSWAWPEPPPVHKKLFALAEKTAPLHPAVVRRMGDLTVH